MANEANQYQEAVKELQSSIAKANAELDALEMKRRETVAYKNGLVDARDHLERIFGPKANPEPRVGKSSFRID